MLKNCIYAMLLLAVGHIAAGAESPSGAVVDPNATATLTIQVIRGTSGGNPVAGDKVLLRVFDHMNVLSSMEATADANGAAVFEDIPTGQRFVAIAKARHGDMMFSSTPIPLTAGADELTGQVQVFDVSTDTSRLTVGIHHMFVRVQGDQLTIVEFMKLSNDTDTAISSAERDSLDRPRVVDIKLPKGYNSLETSGYLQEGELIQTPDGFYDTMAVPPGQFDLNFGYAIDIDAPRIPIKRPLSYNTQDLAVFSELTRATIEGLGEPSSNMMGQDGKPIKYYKLSSLGPGDVLEFTVAGFNVGRSRKTDWIVLAVVFSILGVLALSKLTPGGKTN